MLAAAGAMVASKDVHLAVEHAGGVAVPFLGQDSLSCLHLLQVVHVRAPGLLFKSGCPHKLIPGSRATFLNGVDSVGRGLCQLLGPILTSDSVCFLRIRLRGAERALQSKLGILVRSAAQRNV